VISTGRTTRSRYVLNKVFIYRDREGASRIWQKNFFAAARQMAIPAVIIDFDNLFDRPKSPRSILGKINKRYTRGDKFIARFNERRESSFKPIYPQLEGIFGQKHIFPDKLTVDLYNNKRRQADFFSRKAFPTPHQMWIENEKQLTHFMQSRSLAFPIVRKESTGAASVGVSLIHGPETPYPFLAQEFCAGNDGDIRVMVVGTRVFGFARANRPDDFRASGSGKVLYDDELPLECVQTAYRISRECGFRCMAYDFVKNNAGRWVVVEISYTFLSAPPARCGYYYDAEQNFIKVTRQIGSVERLILSDLWNDR
jgi:hypothetical protein